MKIEGVDIMRRMPTCVLCQKSGTPLMGKAKPKWMEFEICELSKDDGYFHIKRKVNTFSMCRKPVKELHANFRQGFGPLMVLKEDPACCEDCRVWLDATFD